MEKITSKQAEQIVMEWLKYFYNAQLKPSELPELERDIRKRAISLIDGSDHPDKENLKATLLRFFQNKINKVNSEYDSDFKMEKV